MSFGSFNFQPSINPPLKFYENCICHSTRQHLTDEICDFTTFDQVVVEPHQLKTSFFSYEIQSLFSKIFDCPSFLAKIQFCSFLHNLCLDMFSFEKASFLRNLIIPQKYISHSGIGCFLCSWLSTPNLIAAFC